MKTPQFMVTGFGKFPGVETNPTEELVAWLLQDFVANAASGELHAGGRGSKLELTFLCGCCACDQLPAPYRWRELCLRDPGSIRQNGGSVAASRGFSSA